MRYFLRRRADGDGFMLLKDNAAIAGGNLQVCLNAFCNQSEWRELTVTEDVAACLAWLISDERLAAENQTRKSS